MQKEMGVGSRWKVVACSPLVMTVTKAGIMISASLGSLMPWRKAQPEAGGAPAWLAALWGGEYPYSGFFCRKLGTGCCPWGNRPVFKVRVSAKR